MEIICDPIQTEQYARTCYIQFPGSIVLVFLLGPQELGVGDHPRMDKAVSMVEWKGIILS